jgi:hypothetical protein
MTPDNSNTDETKDQKMDKRRERHRLLYKLCCSCFEDDFPRWKVVDDILRQARRDVLEQAVIAIERTYESMYEYLTNTQYREIETLQQAIRALDDEQSGADKQGTGEAK